MSMAARRMTLVSAVEKNAAINGHRVAVVCREVPFTYSDVKSNSDHLAMALGQRGVTKATRVAVLMRNCHRYVEVFLGLSKLGAVMVPLNWRLQASELLYVLRDSDSSLLIHAGDFDETIGMLRAQLDSQVSILNLADIGLESGVDGAKSSGVPANVGDDDIAVQMYTAAFGGRPRGAQVSHGGYMAEAAAVCMALSIAEGGSTLVTVPLFHTYGLELSIATLARGGRCVFVEPFDAQRALRNIEREAVSVLSCAAPHFAGLLEELQRSGGDISSLKTIIGASASKEVRGIVRSRAPEVRFVDAIYGQTECGAIVTSCDTEEAEATGHHCVGRPTVFHDVRVFGEDDTELVARQVGEIVVRGPRVMVGYYKLPEINQESFRGGWRHTGDLGLFDELGYLHYVGRKNELIKSGMENVYPAEVEAVLADHPAVKEVAVIGVPDEEWDEAVTAIVAVRKGCSVSADELIQFCKQHMASYKKPKNVAFVDELPRDGNGQIARQEIKDRYGKIWGCGGGKR